MGLEQVTEEIQAEAEAKATELKDEAKKEAAEIKEKAESRAKHIREQMETTIEEEKAQIRKKELPNARRQARMIKQQAKQESIDKVFDQFRERIKDMDKGRKEELFNAAIESVSKEITIGRVVTSPEMEDAVKSMVDAEIESDTTVAGLRIQNEDGSVTYDFTLSTVCETIESRMRGTVAKILF